MEELSAGAFRVLLRYLYTHELPAAEDGGEGLAAGEMAKAADYFQAGELFEHCVEQFKGGLRVRNVVERLVQAHDLKLEVLAATAMEYLKGNVLAFQATRVHMSPFAFSPLVVAVPARILTSILLTREQREAMPSLDALEKRPDLIHLALAIAGVFASNVPGA